MKAYALKYLANRQSVWSDIIAVANDVNKLTPFMILSDGSMNIGSYDKFNSPNVVRYTTEDVYPQYKIEEVPYVL